MSFRISGTGMYVPDKVVTNDDIAGLVDTSDEWIVHRVGVRQRRVCTIETTADLAYRAALRALEDSGTDKGELDLILAASISADSVSPSVSCMVQNMLGVRCMAMDLSAACAGFVFLLETAAGFFSMGRMKKILVVGAERLSRIVDWEDRSTCVIFGDGAGAAVLERGDGYLDSMFTVSGGDGVINIPNYSGKSPFSCKEPVQPYIHMKGQDTFKFAVHSIARDIPALLERNGLTIGDIRYIVPHQANRRIIESAAAKLQLPLDKFYINIERYGNTSSASIPIALDEINRNGGLDRGDLVILTAFGGGLSSASCLIKW